MLFTAPRISRPGNAVDLPACPRRGTHRGGNMVCLRSVPLPFGNASPFRWVRCWGRDLCLSRDGRRRGRPCEVITSCYRAHFLRTSFATTRCRRHQLPSGSPLSSRFPSTMVAITSGNRLRFLRFLRTSFATTRYRRHQLPAGFSRRHYVVATPFLRDIPISQQVVWFLRDRDYTFSAADSATLAH